MKFIKIKPLSINEAFQGRRFKTPLYRIFTDAVTRLLLAIKPTKPNPDAPMFSHYIFGVSNMQADVDNMVKCFQDRLFSSWGIMIVEKTKTKKGQEFIGFHVDAKANLIEYLENVLARLKAD